MSVTKKQDANTVADEPVKLKLRRMDESESTPELNDPEFTALVDEAANMLKDHMARGVECIWHLGKSIQQVMTDAKYGEGSVLTFARELERRVGRSYSDTHLYMSRQVYLSVPKLEDARKLASKNVAIRNLSSLMSAQISPQAKKHILSELIDGSKYGQDIPSMIRDASEEEGSAPSDHGPIMSDDQVEAREVGAQQCERFISSISSHTKKCREQLDKIRRLRDLMDGQNTADQRGCIPLLKSLQEDLKLLRETVAECENEVSDAIKGV